MYNTNQSDVDCTIEPVSDSDYDNSARWSAALRQTITTSTTTRIWFCVALICAKSTNA